ncbi:unnamed protein product [Cunninghamella blakesleeana]
MKAVFFAGLACFVSAQGFATDQNINCVMQNWDGLKAKYDGNMESVPTEVQTSLGTLKQGNNLVARPTRDQVRSALASGSDTAVRTALDGFCQV